MKKLIFLLGLIFVGLSFWAGLTEAGSAYLPRADLIKGTGPEVYVLENGVKRWIPDPATFERFYNKWTNIKTISDALLDSYPQDDNLGRYDDYPEGTLLKGTDPEVYLIELNKRRWIPNPEIFEGNNLGWKYIYNIDDEKLEKIEQGDNLTLAEPDKYPETIILDGPESGATLETAEITFKYSGSNPLGDISQLSFETYLVGYDTQWRRQYSSYTEAYNLSEESKTYTFYVRAKNEEGYCDPSPASRTFRIGVSPYYQKVEIKDVHAEEDDFQNDYLVLRNEEDQTINITGWTIETSRETVTIPQAAEKLHYLFSSSRNSDIELTERNKVIISTGFSPKGVSFRTNKCAGYLDYYSQFHPVLDKNCPYLEESKYDHLEKDCRDFIDDLSRCEMPNYSAHSEISSDDQCINFLNEKFNYKGCYLEYHQEVDFFGDEWRVFLNKSVDILDNSSDTLILRDKNGLVVDEYEYD